MMKALNRILLIGLAPAISPSIAMAVAPACTVPALSLDVEDDAFARAFSKGSGKLLQVESNFATAYVSACTKGLLKDGLAPLVLLNAPNANIASIHPDDRGKQVLEYPFLTEDGQANVPPVEEIEEAIYCAVVGATPQEQEESGRCLPD